MVRNNYILLYLLGMFSVLACQKTGLPTNKMEAPRFAITAQVNGQSKNFVAGINSIYLFSDKKFINDSTIVLSASFADAQCPDCPNSLSIELHQTTNASNLLNEQALQYVSDMLSDTSISYEYTFGIHPFSDEFSYTWVFNNATGSSQSSIPNPTFTSAFGNMVEFTATHNPTGNIFSSSGSLDINQTDCAFNNMGIFSNAMSIDTSLSIGFGNVGGSDDFTYNWGLNSAEPNINLINSGNYTITVTNLFGCTRAYSALIIDTSNLAPIVIPTFTYEVETITTSSTPLLNGAVIRYIDQTGQEWASNITVQDSTSKCIISNIQPYITNENGIETQELEIDFVCTLYKVNSPNFESIQMEGSGKIAVGL